MEERRKLLDSRICQDKFGNFHEIVKFEVKKIDSSVIINFPQVKRKINVNL